MSSKPWGFHTTSGSYSATLTVIDNSSVQHSGTAQIMSVVANIAPAAIVTVDTDTGVNPITVSFDAFTSADAVSFFDKKATWRVGKNCTLSI